MMFSLTRRTPVGLTSVALLTALSFAACTSDDPGGTAYVAGGSGAPGAVGGAASSGGAAGAPGSAGAIGAAGSPGSEASGGEAGFSGGAGLSGAGAGGEPAFDGPTRLSETGLFSDIASETLSPGVMEFAPAYQLWSDGASKRRWVYLPPGEKIDSYYMDFWTYPVGTKLWKEFTRDGVRVETRFIHKQDEDTWFMVAFEWNESGSDAMAVPDGHTDARGTDHDIPDHRTCRECHDNMPDRVLGFSALQLSHQGPGVTLDQLVSEQRLNAPPLSPLGVPGTDTERAALGYLHANCGHCHNDGGSSEAYSRVNMVLWLWSDALTEPLDTPTYMTTIGQSTQSSSGIGGQRVVPGDPETSVLYRRFIAPEPNLHMPPVGTEITDPAGQQILDSWISSLP